MQGRVYTHPRSDRVTNEPNSPTRRAQRLGALYADLVERFGKDYPLTVRVKVQLDAARTLAGFDDEVRR